MGLSGDASINVSASLGSLLLLFGLMIALLKLRKFNGKIAFRNREYGFLFSILLLLTFVGITEFAYSEASSLGALLAGLAVGNFLPASASDETKETLRSVSFALFAPVFFVWAGAKTSMSYLLLFPYLVLAKVGLTKSVKMIGSYIIGRKKLGTIKSLIMGSCLSVKFSTSIIVFTILFDKGLIGIPLYSVLISSKIVYKFVIPFVLSYLVPKATLTRIEEG